MTARTDIQTITSSRLGNMSGLVPVAALLLLGFALGYAVSDIRQGPPYVANATNSGESSMITDDWHGNVQRSNHY